MNPTSKNKYLFLKIKLRVLQIKVKIKAHYRSKAPTLNSLNKENVWIYSHLFNFSKINYPNKEIMFISVTKYSRLCPLIIQLKIKILNFHIKMLSLVIPKIKLEIIMDILLNNKKKTNWIWNHIYERIAKLKCWNNTICTEK